MFFNYFLLNKTDPEKNETEDLISEVDKERIAKEELLKEQILKKESFFFGFLQNDFFRKKKDQEHKFFLSNFGFINFFSSRQKNIRIKVKDIIKKYFRKWTRDFELYTIERFTVSNRSKYFPQYRKWKFLNTEEFLLYLKMDELWTAVVNYFTEEKYSYLFNKDDRSNKEDDSMLLHSADDLDNFLNLREEGDDEDFYTGLYINDDDNPDFVEIYDDDTYMITFIWSFFFYCFIFCFDFSGFFFFPFFPIIMFHYYMYEPDIFEEEDKDPELIILDNMYKNDIEFVEYQYSFFSKKFLTAKNFDYLFFTNLLRFEKNNYIFKYLKKKHL